MRYDEGVERFARRYWLFWLFTAIGLLFFSYYYLDDLAREHRGTALPRFIEEMTGAYATMVLFPFIVSLTRRFAFSKESWATALLMHLGGLFAFSVAHTTLLALSRSVLFPLAGLGTYDYGLLPYRYPMEASHDAITYPVTVLLIVLFDRLQVARRNEVAAEKLRTELAEAKLENLRLQLHPHFLFNTLNAISAVMYEDVAKADAMLVRLSDFLRVILNSTDAQEVPFEEELQIEGMYFNIMKARLESKLQLQLDIADDVQQALVPSLILQPLIENSIEHARCGDAGLYVMIAARRQNESVRIDVSDSGTAFATESKKGGGGRGVANVRSRLGQFYGEAYGFEMGVGPSGGMQTTLTFPYRSA